MGLFNRRPKTYTLEPKPEEVEELAGRVYRSVFGRYVGDARSTPEQVASAGAETVRRYFKPRMVPK